jgi:hypothetical protein
MGWLVAEIDLGLYKSCNKSFLFGGFSQHNKSFGYEEGRKVGGISFDLQFYFVDTSRVRDGSIQDIKLHLISDYENAATPSQICTEQLTPSCLGFEASNPLKSLLLHCSNVVFNSINKNQISGSQEV